LLDRLLLRAARGARRRADRARDAGDWLEAQRGYRRWLALRPNDGPIWVQLGHALAEAGDISGAADAYRTAQVLMPRDADLLRCWGHAERRRGDMAATLALYERAHALDPREETAAEIARLSPPPPPAELPPAAVVEEPTSAVAPDEQPAPATPPGACEYVDRDVVHGWLRGAEEGDEVLFLAGDAVVAQALPLPDVPRGDGHEFRALLAIRQPTAVRAVRRSDGAELAGSPFEALPASVPTTTPLLARDVRAAVIKPLVLASGRELAILAIHTATGAPKPHVTPYVRMLAEAGIAVLLVVSSDRPVDLPADLLDAAAGVMVRGNAGYDFGAWAHALALHPQAWGTPLLYLLNDSVVPAADERLPALLARVRASAADLVGLTASLEYRWHVQSYFLALKPKALSSFALQHLFRTAEVVDGKDAVIRRFELPLAQRVEEAGCGVEILFPDGGPGNPVLDGWRGLIARGFPFVKVLLLRGAFPHIDLAGWREALAGFDLDVIDQLLAASSAALPADPDDRLYAHPLPPLEGGPPLKVALYGPWNYDNGLGHASRGLIGALRHAGVQLSLHPVRKPFHIHRPLGPATDVRDFAGPADVAVVHLNPDSWHLLTDAQRAEIAAARHRIGYWVWEMGHIPDAWWANFGAADRIWAPSRYCAELFAAQDGAPVDVVPHAVPLPADDPPEPATRAVLLRDLGVDPARRVILYLFDGSSYLVRKNPAALVRAFAASGLATRGWTLLLKTKHLHDRPAEGAALRSLVAGEDGVVLVDRALDAAALARLMACADIYASPHCSEGFGLTVAEAMAAGRLVVATDFSGTADLLDAGTGFPVRAHRWQLAEDHGHYTRGGVWARVDEPALAHALSRAAAVVEAGEDSSAQAARARVAERLSFAAVGAAIARSLAATVRGRPAREPVRTEALNLRAGVPAERGFHDPGVHVTMLAADGAVPGGEVPGSAEWVVLAPAGSMLSPLLAATLRTSAAARPDVAIFYADDVAGAPDRAIDQFRLKPEFDRILLAAQDYVGAPVMVRAGVLAALGGLDPTCRTAAVADLLFRADAAGHSIARIPQILLAHPGARVRATSDDYRAMLRAQPLLADYAVGPGLAPHSFALARRYPAGGEPPVTLVIPTRRSALPDGNGTWVAQLLDAIAHADWPMDRLSVLVGDDLPDEPDWMAVPRPYALRRIATPRAPGEPFHYAAKMNRLWREVETEQLVFMNDDIRLGAPGWLRALQTFALDRGVGGVGARLLFPDGSLQHAGLVPHGTCAAHAWIYRERAEGTFHEWARVHRQWSMVTGAVFATRRSLMEEVNGFDEAFAVEFNDTDLCLRLRALGYRIVCTPQAEMVHAEKVSRGEAPPAGDTIARFLERWGGWLADDPAFHPLLRRDRFELRPDIGRRQWFY